MTREQAINILKPQGTDPADVKTAYREAALKYHPDRNPNGLELMKLVNLAFEFLAKHSGKWTLSHGSDDRPLTEAMQEVFDKIRHFPGLAIEVCGTWLWISGETYNYKAELRAVGAKWSRNKRSWYWSPPGYRKRSKRVFDMPEIRATFGSFDLESEPLTQMG